MDASPKLVPLALSRALFPGDPPAVSTIRKWVRVGYHGHRLNALRRCGRLYLSAEIVADFMAATGATTPVVPVVENVVVQNAD